MSVMEHMSYQLRNSIVKSYPFPHFYCQDVFPKAFYEDLLASLPAKAGYTEGTTKYHGRTFGDAESNPLLTFMRSKEFLYQIANIFLPNLQERYPDGKVTFFTDLRLVRDPKAYQIGPHTDARWKLISLLFYFPPDDALRDLGTSVYIPKDLTFTCEGGPHHPFEPFTKVYTAPFLPNSCFGFFKTEKSFHGVDPIQIDCQRDVLLYNIYDRALYEAYHTPPGS